MTSASQPTPANAYDTLPYYSAAFQDTHPGHLAAVARLFNLQPPLLQGARILELGSAAGGNIIPIALHYPDTTFVGVDYSSVQIEQGRRLVDDLGLADRITLLDIDIADLDESLAPFDYIICHGVYSWVPAAVQQAILHKTRQLLAPNGLAVISYNTYPGWKSREMIREAMLYHTRSMDLGLTDRVAHARQLAERLYRLSEDEESLHHETLEYLNELLEDAEDYYFAHEYLEDLNTPLYFTDFIDQVDQHSLAYVADTDVDIEFPDNFGEEAAEELLSLSDHNQIRFGQYADFIVNRAFRRSIVTHEANAEAIDREVKAGVYEQLYYLVPECTPVVDDESGEPSDCFEFWYEVRIEAQNAIERHLLESIAKLTGYPFSSRELAQRACQQYGGHIPTSSLIHVLERCVTEGAAVAWSEVPPEAPLRDHFEATPMIPEGIRAFLGHGEHITNGVHHNYFPDAWGRRLISLLDGRHRMGRIRQIMHDELQAGQLTVDEVEEDDAADTADPEHKPSAEQQMTRFLEVTFDYLRENGFLSRSA